MLTDFYKPDIASVQTLLERGIASGAFVKGAGWTHEGLADLVKKYGLVGTTYELASSKNDEAFSKFKNVLNDGPVIVSIHRNFDSKNSNGHIVVVTGLDNDFVYYNDPGKRDGKKKISLDNFKNGWKRSFIVVRQPVAKSA
jgi:uncharacterized protein YvpB